jgi:long-chain acyl-CoA synthetase
MILDAFARNAADLPQRAAIIQGQRRIGFAELHRRSIELAAGLAEAGIGRGMPVGVMLRSSFDFPLACLALWHLAAVLVPFDPGAPSDDQTARESIIDLPFVLADFEFRPARSGTRVLRLDAIARPGAAPPGSGPGPDDECTFMFTSGTTGRPKALVHTHASMYEMVRRGIEQAHTVIRGDVVLATTPLQLGIGLIDFVATPLVAGATTVLVQPFSARLALEAALEHGVTSMVSVPAVIKLLAALPESGGRPNFRRVTVGTAWLEADVYERFHARYGVRPARAYGMSEIGRIATTGTREESAFRPTAGWPLVELRVLDDRGDDVPKGETGEVAVRGPSLCRTECRAEGGVREPLPMAGGWLLTGDIGRLEPDGALILVGRKKSFINGPRLKVDPREVEEVVRRMPGVRDAVVVPAPGRGGYEAIRAVIVADAALGEAAVSEYCSAHLPPGKRPQIVDFVDAIPRNASGKVEFWRLAGGAGPPTRP